MATFKTCVRKRRNDGFWYVYIRVTHQKKVGYIKTDKMVSDAGLNSKGDVTDPYVTKWCADRILEYVNAMNRTCSENWCLNDVIQYLQTCEEDVCFSDYARMHMNRMRDEGHARNARNYELSLQHLERFAGTTRVMCSMLTSTFVNNWIKSLEGTRRAKEMYPICIRQVFKAACTELNDYDRGVMRIKTDPWRKVEIPEADRTEKLAITPGQCREFFGAPIPESDSRFPSAEFGHDIAMMIICLGGINTVDLYNMRKEDYYDGVLHYRRAKTMRSRSDEAYMEMRVPDMLMPTMEKYMEGADDGYLFNFHKRLHSSDSMGAKANKGIRMICESLGMAREDWYCCYTFRHTWGTVAQNDCGASIAEVAFGMNHASGHRVTRGYLKLNFEPAWELNEKVVELIFFTDKDSSRLKEEPDRRLFDKFSRKHLMRGTVYFMGRTLGSVENIGYSNVEEIIGELCAMVPDDMPNRCRVQIKIENLDKRQTAFYERMKGVGF